MQTDYFIKIISLSHILLHRKNNFIDTIIYCFMELMLNNPSLQLYFPFRPCHKSLSLIYAGFDSVNCLPHTDIASKQPRSSQYKYVGPCFLHFGYIIKAAIEKAGATPDMSVSDLCEALKTAMTEITVDGVTGSMTWSADGEPTKEPKAMIIKDGAYSAL